MSNMLFQDCDYSVKAPHSASSNNALSAIQTLLLTLLICIFSAGVSQLCCTVLCLFCMSCFPHCPDDNGNKGTKSRCHFFGHLHVGSYHRPAPRGTGNPFGADASPHAVSFGAAAWQHPAAASWRTCCTICTDYLHISRGSQASSWVSSYRPGMNSPV